MLSKHISAGLLMVSEVLEPRPKRRQQFSVYTGEFSTVPKSQGLTPGPTRPLYQAFTASARSHRLRLRQTFLLSRLRTTKSFRSHIHSTSHSQTVTGGHPHHAGLSLPVTQGREVLGDRSGVIKTQCVEFSKNDLKWGGE